MSADRYEYTPLAWRRQIRLLKIHPAASPNDPEVSIDLVPILLDAAPPFEALSYAWGEPLPRHEIHCSGRSAEIGPSLYSALYHLRQQHAPPRTRWIWADAICINQNDNAERESQVRMMGDIYSRASVTVIWLGEEDDYVKRAFDWLMRFRKTWEPIRKSFNVGHIDHAQRSILHARLSKNNGLESRAILQAAFGDEIRQTEALEDIWMLLHRPWFTRKWVIQEVAMSTHHRIVFLAGQIWTDWVAFNSWFLFLDIGASVTGQRWFSSFPGAPDSDKLDAAKAHSVFLRGSILASCSLSNLPISRLLVSTAMFKCTDTSDHIIALLGIAGDFSIFEDFIDYDIPTEDLYRRLTSVHLNDGLTLKILWSALTIIPVDRRRSSSWIPAIEELALINEGFDVHNLTKYPHRMANACGSTDIEATTSGQKLLIKGRIVDAVEQLGANLMTVIPRRSSYHESFTAESQWVSSLWVSWFDECQSMAESASQDESIFIDTMLIENLFVGIPSEFIAAAKKDFFKCRRIWETLAAAADEQTWFETRQCIDSDTVTSMAFIYEFDGHMKFRRFGRTRDGRIGWMPLVAEEGDLICVLDGMEFPYALRQREGSEGIYVLVGECLIPSLMDGE